MRNKQHKANIKMAKDFIALWVKFHNLYKDATGKEAISQEEEKLLLETKSLITNKYMALKDSLRLNFSGDDRAMDVISNVLSLKSVAAMSDKALDRLEQSWKHSYSFLNKILKNLENQNHELAKRKSAFGVLKSVLSKNVTQFIILVLVVFIMAYIMNVVIKLLVK